MEERLKKFASIVDAGSFTAASERLHISQPALTTAVQKLERELKAELVIRSSHGIRLTPAGKLAYDAAKQISIHTSNLHHALNGLHSQKTPFALGAIDAVADLLFVHGTYLEHLQQTTHLSLSIDNSHQILRLLERDEIELGLIAKPADYPKSFTAKSLGHEPLVLVCSPGQATQIKTRLARGKLDTFLAYNQRSRTHELIADFFVQQHIQVVPTFYSTSPHILLHLARAGRGIAALPYLLVQHDLAAGTLTHITIGKHAAIARDIIAIHRNGKLLHQEAEGLLAYATSQLAVLTEQLALARPEEKLDIC